MRSLSTVFCNCSIHLRYSSSHTNIQTTYINHTSFSLFPSLFPQVYKQEERLAAAIRRQESRQKSFMKSREHFIASSITSALGGEKERPTPHFYKVSELQPMLPVCLSTCMPCYSTGPHHPHHLLLLLLLNQCTITTTSILLIIQSHGVWAPLGDPRVFPRKQQW